MNVLLILVLVAFSVLDARYAIENIQDDAPGIAAFMFFASAFTAAVAATILGRLA